MRRPDPPLDPEGPFRRGIGQTAALFALMFCAAYATNSYAHWYQGASIWTMPALLVATAGTVLAFVGGLCGVWSQRRRIAPDVGWRLTMAAVALTVAGGGLWVVATEAM